MLKTRTESLLIQRPMPAELAKRGQLDDVARTLVELFRRDLEKKFSVAYGKSHGAACEEQSIRWFALVGALGEYRNMNRYREGLRLALWAYEFTLQRQLMLRHMINGDFATEARIHKGGILFQVADFYDLLGWTWHSRRFRVLSLVEDILTGFLIRNEPQLGSNKLPDEFVERAGNYRFFVEQIGVTRGEILDLVADVAEVLVGQRGLTRQDRITTIRQQLDSQIQSKRFSRLGLSNKSKPDSPAWHEDFILFPEWFAGRLKPKSWLTCRPSEDEINSSSIGTTYSRALWQEICDPAHLAAEARDTLRFKSPHKPESVRSDAYLFEELGRYLLACIPGFRCLPNERTESGEFDVLVVRECENADFRAALSPYFLCECKWETNSVSTPEFMVVAQKLRHIGANFGVLFSKKSLAGDENLMYAKQQQITAWAADRTIVINITKEHLDELISQDWDGDVDTPGFELTSTLTGKPPEVNLRIGPDPLEMIRQRYEVQRVGIIGTHWEQ